MLKPYFLKPIFLFKAAMGKEITLGGTKDAIRPYASSSSSATEMFVFVARRPDQHEGRQRDDR